MGIILYFQYIPWDYNRATPYRIILKLSLRILGNIFQRSCVNKIVNETSQLLITAILFTKFAFETLTKRCHASTFNSQLTFRENSTPINQSGTRLLVDSTKHRKKVKRKTENRKSSPHRGKVHYLCARLAVFPGSDGEISPDLRSVHV